MKPIIHKRTERHKSGDAERIVIYFLGICIYIHEYPIDRDTKPRNVGFIQYPSNAPTEVEDEDYYPEE